MNMSQRQFKPPDARIMRALYAIGLGPLVGRLVLLLTTTGRKTGLPRVTPLQYEQDGETFCLGSSRGTRADWVRNILVNPRVQVRVKSRRFAGCAEVVTDPARVADFLELRLRNHPRIVGRILQAEGLPASPTRADLEAYAARLALVVIRPEQER
jgi:deazaflavin-dependent oxidoreductase (nitroreductase family)